MIKMIKICDIMFFYVMCYVVNILKNFNRVL